MADYATLLRNHVTLRCRSIDRIFMQAYVPKLQSVRQVCIFLRWQRGFKIPSSAAFGKIGEAYVKAIHQYAEQHKIPIVHFEKGQDHRRRARHGAAVALVGIVIGVAGGLALARTEGSLIYGVNATDPITFISVPVVLLAVALVATAIPARRAAILDPNPTLRTGVTRSYVNRWDAPSRLNRPLGKVAQNGVLGKVYPVS